MERETRPTSLVPSICLTPVQSEGAGAIQIIVSQLIAYAQEQGFTRLQLTGGRTMDVQETTDCIDLLVRRAFAGS